MPTLFVTDLDGTLLDADAHITPESASLLRGLIGRNTPLEEAGFYVNYYVADPTILRALDCFGEPRS